MEKRLFTVFLVILAGCGGQSRPSQRLPVASSPEQVTARLPVDSGEVRRYPGKCGCGCSSFACLYGNCGRAGIPSCCEKCTCIKHSSNIDEINKSASELLNKLKAEEPAPSSPGKSVSEPKAPKEVYKETPVEQVPIHKWYRIQGKPGLWGYGVLNKENEIVDITNWYQQPHNHQR